MRLMRPDGCWVGWALRSALWGVWSECEVRGLVFTSGQIEDMFWCHGQQGKRHRMAS
jgi:hypothetical protein